MASSNFGPLCRDAFSQNVHIKGSLVIDHHQNIRGNTIISNRLHVSGNAQLGNIVSNNLIIGNVITASLFVGPIIGKVYDETGTQILDLQQPSIADPNVVSTFIPGSNVNDLVVPQYSMPALGANVIPMSSDIPQDSVEHLLYFNHVNLRAEVANLRAQVIMILNALRTHGVIAP